MGEQAQRFWDELAAVYEAAARPTLGRLVRLGHQQSPPAAVSDATISGWLNRRTVPGPAHTRYFLAMATFLQAEAARGSGGYAARPEEWWRQLLLRARQDRKGSRGGRPARKDPQRPLAAQPLAGAGATPDALSTLPAPGPRLAGRARELDTILALLRPEEGDGMPAPPVAVSGLGGAGKTSLALHAAHAARHADWFPGGVYFVDLHGAEDHPVAPDNAVQALLRALGVAPERIPPTPDERAGLYRSVLERTARARGPVLLLADNAAASSQVVPLLPGDPAHRVLITSRNVLAQLGAQQVRLPMLTPDASLEALAGAVAAAACDDRRLAREEAAAREVCRLCGHLPLALQIAAALLIADPGKPVAELADELRDVDTRMEYLDDGERGVRATFDLSCRRLTGEQAHLFRLMALAPGPDVSAETLAASHGGPLPPRAVDALVRAHLVEPRNARGRWRVHDLVRAYAVAGMRADEGLRLRWEEARTRLLDHYGDRVAEARKLLLASAGTPAPGGFADRDEALAWLDAERTSLMAATAWAADPGHAAAAVRLALGLGEYFGRRRLFDDAVVAYEQAVHAARRLGDRFDEAKSANNLGVALRRTRRLEESAEACRAALRAYAEVSGTEEYQARTWYSLGDTLGKLRRFDEAAAAHGEAARLAGRAGDTRALARAENGRGYVLLHQSRFAEARTALERAGALLKDGDEPFLEALVVNNLGRVLRHTGHPEEAESAHRRARDAFARQEEREAEGTCRNERALALADLGEFAAALEEQRTALALLRDVGERHREATVSHDLGLTLQGLGRHAEAAEAYAHAADLFADLRDPYHLGRARERLAAARALAGKDRQEDTGAPPERWRDQA
ncbi:MULTISPECIES: tetratricopeptide repeat protein [Streptomyces]|uniref:tetratricopeptide repeat protein n=2 Tax=Streptomyces TaxID=1883 RepID=UPI000AAF96E2|nr:tetratricopeptide repeat protein [Streptomyces sp. NRRL F-5193]